MQRANLTYAEKLRDPRWQKKRLEILNLAKWQCEDCGTEKVELHIHHSHYLYGVDPWDHPGDLMTVVCKSCHKERQLVEQTIHTILGYVCQMTDLTTLRSHLLPTIARDFRAALFPGMMEKLLSQLPAPHRNQVLERFNTLCSTPASSPKS